MAISTVYINSKGKDNLARLKRNTGVKNWNTLCRWALCYSLSEETPPPPIDKGVEIEGLMTWKVFSGQYEELYLGLIKLRCKEEGLEPTDKICAEQFRLHIHRGLARLIELDGIKVSRLPHPRSPVGLVELASQFVSFNGRDD